LNILRTVNYNLFLVFWLLLFFRFWWEVPIGLRNMFRNLSLFRDDSWSKWSCKLISLIFLLGLFLPWHMYQFMDTPVLFEAILTTKVRSIKIHLFADRTDHCSLLPTARSPTFIIPFHSWYFIYAIIWLIIRNRPIYLQIRTI